MSNKRQSNLRRHLFLLCVMFGLGLKSPLQSQIALQWNANIDLELTVAGDLSHYYYNEIHRDYNDLIFDLSRSDLILKMDIKDQWQINAHGMTERYLGKRGGLFSKWDSYKIRIPQLNLRWQPKDQPFSVTIGQLINPFGNFYSNQLNADRTFILAPLAYGYYSNVSSEIGFVNGLFEDQKVEINGQSEWGNPHFYRLGYKTGIKLNYGVPGKINYTLAIVDGALNRINQSGFFDHLGVVGKLSVQPNYFSKLALSFSHGSFLEENTITENLNSRSSYRQTALSVDYEFGFGFFEWNGAFHGIFYKVPIWEEGPDSSNPNIVEDETNLSSYAISSSLKYEPPFLSGSFAAYQFEALLFGNFDETNGGNESWDDLASRHSIVLGYKVNEFIIAKTSFTTQATQNRNWANSMRTFRTMLSFHW